MSASRGGSSGLYLLIGGLSAAGYLASTLAFHVGHAASGLRWMVALFLALSALWAAALARASVAPPRTAIVLGFAVLFRLLLLPAGYAPEGGYERFLLYDDRVWRYLWEGHMWSLGQNPLVTPPADLDALQGDAVEGTDDHAGADDLWPTVLDNVSNRDAASPYPIGAHALFRLAHAVAPGSVLFWKLLMVGCDLGVIALVAGLARRLRLGVLPVLAYAWNPLVVKEFSGSGHVDAALVVLMVLALRGGPVTGSLWLALAALVKPVALLLAPPFCRRGGWRATLAPAAAVAALAVWFPHGLTAYATDLLFNSTLYRLVPAPRAGLLAAAAAAIVALSWYCWRTDDGSDARLVRQGVTLIGATLLAAPVVSPWYLTWVVPFAALTRSTFWLAWSGTVFLAYYGYLDRLEQPVLLAIQVALPVVVWRWLTARGADEGRWPIGTRALVSMSSGLAAIGGLCCLTPIVLVLLGASSVAFAATLGNALYGDYRWLFRLVSFGCGVGALAVYVRRRGVCTLDDLRQRRRAVVDLVFITLFASATAYIVLTYLVLQAIGVWAGLPWRQYDESWAGPVAAVLVLATAALVVATRPEGPARGEGAPAAGAWTAARRTTPGMDLGNGKARP